MPIAVMITLVFLTSCSSVAPSEPQGMVAAGGTVSVAARLSKNEDLRYVFDDSSLPSVTIELSTQELNKQLKTFDLNHRHEKMGRVDFMFDKNGVVDRLGNVGFRIKGNTSRRRMAGTAGHSFNLEDPQWHQSSFVVDFNKYDDKKTFRSLKKLDLRFFRNDPTYVRMAYSENLLRKFGVWSTPLASYARMYIKIKETGDVAYLGLYQLTEHVDKTFLESRFPEKAEGYLWKCTGCVIKQPVESTSFGIEDINNGEESLSYRPSFDLKLNKSNLRQAKNELIRFIRKFDSLDDEEFQKWVESAFDTELFLRSLAVRTAIADWDGYWVNDNNFYLYFRPRDQKFYFIPHDFDNVLGQGGILANAGTQNPLSFGATYKSKLLVYRLLTLPKYRHQYKEFLAELIDPKNAYLDPQASIAAIRAIYALIDPNDDGSFVRNDTDAPQKIADASKPSSNTPQYRLLTGDASGVLPEANFFATRVRIINEALIADAAWQAPSIKDLQTSASAQLFLVGTFNGWSFESDTGSKRYNQFLPDASGKPQQTLDIDLARGVHQFKVSDRSQTHSRTFLASRGDSILRVGESFDDNFGQHLQLSLFPKDIDDTLNFGAIQVAQGGRYRFIFDYSDPEKIRFEVILLEVDPSSTLHSATTSSESSIFLRGDFNQWSTAFQLEQAAWPGVYSIRTFIRKGYYKFKFADANWSKINIGAADGADADVTMGESVNVYSGEGAQDLRIQIPKDGNYIFTLDLNDPSAAILEVKAL